MLSQQHNDASILAPLRLWVTIFRGEHTVAPSAQHQYNAQQTPALEVGDTEVIVILTLAAP